MSVGVFGTVTDAGLLAGREIKQFFRRPTRLLSFVMQPLIFLFIFGVLIDVTLRPQIGNVSYIVFILPGLVGQRMITTASRGGMGLIRDRHAGFLKEVLVAPVPRTSVLLGLSVGHVFRSVLQGMLLLAIGFFFLGLTFGGGPDAFLNFLVVMAIVFTMGLSIVMISMAIAWKMDDVQNFATMTGYITFPLFLLSGALYRLDRMPPWLAIPSRLNPLTYAVDAMRYFAIGPEFAHFPLHYSVMVIGGFAMMCLGIGLMVMRTQQAD